jgi:hypothetical protein
VQRTMLGELEGEGGRRIMLRNLVLSQQRCGQWKANHSSLRSTRLNPASHCPREGWGVDISNPDEMAACLSMVPVPSAIIDLVRKIKQVNKKGGDFYIDFEFASLPRPRKEGKVVAERIPVEIAVLRLDG